MVEMLWELIMKSFSTLFFFSFEKAMKFTPPYWKKLKHFYVLYDVDKIIFRKNRNDELSIESFFRAKNFLTNIGDVSLLWIISMQFLFMNFSHLYQKLSR